MPPTDTDAPRPFKITYLDYDDGRWLAHIVVEGLGFDLHNEGFGWVLPRWAAAPFPIGATVSGVLDQMVALATGEAR